MKECNHCQSSFQITQKDHQFYKKMDVPPPTLCPDCRMQRRMVWRNERSLHRRKCDITGEDIISVYAPDAPVNVCKKDHWYSDVFDPMQYGRDYDFNRPFFEQFHDLMKAVPFSALRVERSENCDFNNDMSDCSNCYLCARTHQSQDMLYCYRGNKSSDCADCYQVVRSQHLYECVECVNCVNSKYLYFSSECSDSAFLIDCRNCSDCFMSTNLRNKRYVFLNEQLTKEDYFKKLAEFDFSSHAMTQKAFRLFESIKNKAIHRAIVSEKSEDCTGDNFYESKNCHDCFGVKFVEDGAYLWNVMEYKDSMDAYSGGRHSELCYEVTSVTAAHNIKFCVRVTRSSDIAYSLYLQSSNDCFGSIALRHKKYCILNKQYTQEEYEALMPKIIEHMKSTGEWGQFFPVTLSPFAYNETVAAEYFPISESEIRKRHWRWRDPEDKILNVSKTIPASKLPDNIKDIPDDVLNWAMTCERTKRPFKITAQELRFYRDHNLPMPRLHPDERYKDRLKWKRVHKLYEGTCDKCHSEIQTTYAPNRPEVVYCEECYLKEIY